MSAAESFSKDARLRRSKDFKRVLSSRTKVVNRHFVFIGCHNSDYTSRLGIIVTKKLGKANVRNKLKRQLRELFRRNRPYVSCDLVIIGRQAAVDVDFAVLEASYRAGIKKLKRKLEASQG